MNPLRFLRRIRGLSRKSLCPTWEALLATVFPEPESLNSFRGFLAAALYPLPGDEP